MSARQISLPVEADDPNSNVSDVNFKILASLQLTEMCVFSLPYMWPPFDRHLTTSRHVDHADLWLSQNNNNNMTKKYWSHIAPLHAAAEDGDLSRAHEATCLIATKKAAMAMTHHTIQQVTETQILLLLIPIITASTWMSPTWPATRLCTWHLGWVICV